MFLKKKLMIFSTIIVALTAVAFAKYDIYPDTMAVGDVAKPEDGVAFVVQSTTKSSVPCPKMTEVQRDALADLSPGFCIFNTTAAGTQFYNGSTWLNAGSGAVLSEWATGTAYGVGNFVYTTPDYKLWVANTSHTAGATFAGDIANWDELSSGMSAIGSSTDNGIARWDGTTGNAIQDSSVTIDDTDNLSTTGTITTGSDTGAAYLNAGVITADTNVSPTELSYLDGVTSAIQTQLDAKVDEVSSTDNAITRFDGTGGSVQDSGVTIDDSDNIATTGEITVGSGSSLEFDVQTSLYRARSTGMSSPTTLAVNGGDNTKFDIGAVTGQIVDTTGVTYTEISYAGATAVTPTNANGASYLLINSAGNLVQQTTVPTPDERRQNIFVGRVVTVSTVVTATVVEPVITENLANSLWDLMLALGFFNDSGNLISANGANLSFDKTSGFLFAPGGNYDTDRDDPNRVSLSSCTACTFFRLLQTGTSPGSATTLDVGNYDNGGSVTAIGGSGNRSTNFRIYIFPSGNIVAVYGQTIYSTLDDAQAGIATESFIKNPLLEGGVLIAIVSVQRTATDLSDTSQAKFSYPNQFGETASGSGSTAAATLQGAYENSSQPQITVTSALGGVQVVDASTPIAAPLFEILSNDTLTEYFAVSDDAVSTDVDILMAGTGQLDLPAGTTAQRSGSPNSGMLRFNTDTSSFEGYDGSAWGSIGGAGGSGVNYITNSDIEANDDGYSEFDDGSFPPTDGTGGTTSVTAARSTTSGTYTPIRGTGSLLFTKTSGADYTGEGFSVDFTVDKGQQARKLTGSVWVLANDPECVDDALKITVYDVTNTNMIRVNGEGIKCSSVPYEHYFQFQTASDSTSYRAVFTYDNTDTNEVLYYFDEISVGPTKLARGAIVTDWKSFSPTTSLTINTTVTGFERRVGDTWEAEVKISFDGVNTQGSATITTPYTIDESRLSGSTDYSNALGEGTIKDASGGYIPIKALYDFTNNNILIAYNFDNIGSSTNAIEITGVNTSTNAPIVFVSGDEITLRIKAPIQGWSSNAQMSEDLGGRPVILKAAGTNTTAATSGSGAPIVFTSTEKDTANGFDGTTYTIKESGYYLVKLRVESVSTTGGSNFISNLVVDGVTRDRIFDHRNKMFDSDNARKTGTGVSIEYFTKGEEVEFTILDPDATNLDAAELFMYKLDSMGSQTILETETVVARYTTNTPLSVGAGDVDVIYEDLVTDTHGAYNTATGDYTVPVTGCYQYNFSVANDGSDSYSTAQNMNIDVKVNGTDIDRGIQFGSGGSGIIHLHANGIICVDKGDVIDIDAQSSVSTNLITTSKYNIFSIARIK